jgi:hypothetical protein
MAPSQSGTALEASSRTKLRRKYDFWCFEACTMPSAAILARILQLRVYVRRRQLPMVRKYLAATKLEAYKWAHQARTGESPSRTDTLCDLPMWTIPGLGVQLTENVQGYFWMSWPVIVDGALYDCDALMERGATRNNWWIWRGRAGEQKEFIGTFHSLRETRAATRRAPGPSGHSQT